MTTLNRLQEADASLQLAQLNLQKFICYKEFDVKDVDSVERLQMLASYVIHRNAMADNVFHSLTEKDQDKYLAKVGK